MIFRRTFQLLCIDETVEQRIVEFWRRRGVRLRRRRNGTWAGRRGRLWGVLSGDFTRWPTRVRVRSGMSAAVECTLRIDTRIATFTEESRPLPDAELEAFAGFVAGQRVDLAYLEGRCTCRPWWLVGLLRLRLGALRGPRRIRGSAGIFDVLTRTGSCFVALLVPIAAYASWVAWQLYLSRYSKPFNLWDDCVVPILFLVGCLSVLLACSLLLVRQRRQARRCLSAEQVAAQFGTTPEEAQRALAERGVKPRFIVDGLPVYDPAHVTDAGLLLRPADPPVGETLLRAAVPADLAYGSNLLRPADEDQAAARCATAEPAQLV